MTNAARAQTARVSARTGQHDGYSRLVFDWPGAVKQSLKSPQLGTLVISFDKAAQLDLSQAELDKTLNIFAVNAIAQDPLSVQIGIPKSSRYRSFNAGSKVVVDVYDPTDGVRDKAPQQISQHQETPQKQPPAKEDHTAHAAVKTAVKVEPVESENLPQIKAPKLTQPLLISLASSKSMGLAVFESQGQLWIVNDAPGVFVTPQISGPNAKAFQPMETVDLKDGAAFITHAPQNGSIRTQGGGLLWKIIMGPQDAKAKPVAPIRKSGKILWPFREPGKLIKIKDPQTGFMLYVVTSKNAKDFSGLAYRFVEFDVLPAQAGLVLRPKVEDLAVKITDAGVEVTRTGGLSVTSEAQIAAREKQAAPDHAAKADAGPVIFNFKDWQLGGLKAVPDNHAIMMGALNDMPERARDEAIMNLAKMYLANALAPESLGFLHILEQNAPDLAQTPEFRAIRGAARALAYKSEGAFSDLSTKDLERFPEIGLWKAFALADLGDWQQAIEVIPENIGVLYEYPEFIATRLGLVAAEVELRAGRIAVANEILEIVKQYTASMNAPQKAALAYLQGESARQAGDTDKTIELWEPLTKGPDDLYRAKAGLALTRLKVNEGALKPAAAIDNLERLRYAWRGDELESLINYWLGRTYFE
ncbi:MAG: tetratricopeptide repeat protein, partial [Bdellovibrionales bacterium]